MYKRGSALIMVVFTMLIIFALGLSLLSVIGKNMIMSRLGADSASAYYIAECGIERASSLIENDTRKIISGVIQSAQDSYNNNALAGVDTPDELYDFIINRINAEFLIYLNPFKEGSFYKRFSPFQGEEGTDGKELSVRSAPEKSFYTVKIEFSPFDWNAKTFRTVNIVSTGHSGNGTRIIESTFYLNYPFCVIEAPGQYSDLPEFLNSSLTVINNGGAVFDSCSILCDGDILVESKSITFKNSSINTKGKLILKGNNIGIYNNVKIFGSTVFDYDDIKMGDKTEINGNKNCSIADSIVGQYAFYPPMIKPDNAASYAGLPESEKLNSIIHGGITGINNTFSAYKSDNGINYVYYMENDLLDNGIFRAEPDDVYVIISRGDLTIKSDDGSPISFKGIIYCGGCLSIYSDDFSLSGKIICRKADFKGSIKIQNNVYNPGQLDEITSTIQKSLLTGGICVLEEYDFCCRGWQE